MDPATLLAESGSQSSAAAVLLDTAATVADALSGPSKNDQVPAKDTTPHKTDVVESTSLNAEVGGGLDDPSAVSVPATQKEEEITVTPPSMKKEDDALVQPKEPIDTTPKSATSLEIGGERNPMVLADGGGDLNLSPDHDLVTSSQLLSDIVLEPSPSPDATIPVIHAVDEEPVLVKSEPSLSIPIAAPVQENPSQSSANSSSSPDAPNQSALLNPLVIPVAQVATQPAAAAVAPPAESKEAKKANEPVSWNWWGWGRKKSLTQEEKAALEEEAARRALMEAGEAERRERVRQLELQVAKQRAEQAAHEKALKEQQHAKEKPHEKSKHEKDPLGGTKAPFGHSLFKYTLNKLFGFQEWEPGMEEQYREVLCRELITLQTETPHEYKDSDVEIPLQLEMSHFYPATCHSTPLPVIIVRTPYDRAMMRHTAERICQHGYHVIIQDTRNSPNAAAMNAKLALSKAQQKKSFQAVVEEANAIRKKYAAKSPKPAGSTEVPAQLTVADANTKELKSVVESASVAANAIADNEPAPTSLPTAGHAQLHPTTSSSNTNSTHSSNGSLPTLTNTPQEFFPIVHESTDGLATIDWVSKQPWCDGNISFYGASYLGIAQYAVVDHKHPALKCIVPVISASRVYNILYPEGSFNLDLAARWLFLMFHPSVTGPGLTLNDQTGETSIPVIPGFWKRSYARIIGSRAVIPKALNHLPLCDLDELVTEKKLAFFQEMLLHGHDETAQFWKEKQVKLCDLRNSPPLLIVEGWYDLFLQQALRDYREALGIWKEFQQEIADGKHSPEELAKMPSSIKTFKPYLTIMNSVHIDIKQLYRISLQESLAWFDFHLKPNKAHRLIARPDEKSVKIQMINASTTNQDRHLALIAKRKKAEKRAEAEQAKSLAHSAAAASQLLLNSAQQPAAEHLLQDLLSPKSKARYRQNLLDAEWRYFSEFPPVQSRPTMYYLYCDVDPNTGQEQRLLRPEPPGERERLKEMMEVVKKEARVKVKEEKQAAAVANGAPPSSTTSSASNSRRSSFNNLSIAIPSSANGTTSTGPPSPAILPTQPFSCYTYDPRDPTPAIGGTSFDVENSGGLDNRPLEARSDILVFTSAPLTQPLVVIGFVRCTLYVRSNVPCTDFVARLCDVYPTDEFASRSDRKRGSGKSQILCDGLFKVTPTKLADITVEAGTPGPAKSPVPEIPMDFVKVEFQASSAPHTTTVSSSSTPPDMVSINILPFISKAAADFAHPFFPISAPDLSKPLLKLSIDMWATGNVFQVGHRIRFQVCSAAHPRWVRSLGGADPMFFGLEHAKLQHQTVYHDIDHPSALILPVLPE